MTTFVDTSAFLAVLSRGDQFHQEAAELWQDLINQGERLICNNYVIVETTALLQRRFGPVSYTHLTLPTSDLV